MNKKIDSDELFKINEEDKYLEQNKFKLNKDETTKSSKQISREKHIIIFAIIAFAILVFLIIIFSLL